MPPGRVATASELFPHAVAFAHSVDPGARLIGAQIIETTDPSRFIAQYRLERPAAKTEGQEFSDAVVSALAEGTRGDGAVGDGYAEKGAFHFEVPGGVLAVVVRAGGSITFDRTIAESGKGAGELRRPIDSNEASDLLAAADANFRGLRGTGHVMVWDLVKTGPENAYRQGGMLRASPVEGSGSDPQLDGDAPDYCELAGFKVDALTGAVLSHGNLHTPTSGKQWANRCDT